jgi:integrase
MASVSKRGDAYRVVWRDRHGVQKQQTFARRKDADARRAEVEVELRTGKYVDPRLARSTLATQWESWVQHRRVSEARRALEASLWRVHLQPRWGDTRLEDVEYEAAQAWVNDLADTMSPEHVRSCFLLLSGLLDAAVRSQRLGNNPVRLVKVRTAPRPPITHADVLDAKEVAATANAVEQKRWAAFVFASAWLGWRLGEGLGIRRCDINLLRGEVTVGRYVVEEVGGRVRLRPGAKNQSSTGRVVPLPASVAKALEEHIDRFVDDPHPEACIFVLDNGCHPSRANLLKQVLRPALARAGVSSGATMRQLGERWLVHWHDGTGAVQRETFADRADAAALLGRVGSVRSVDFRHLRHTAASLMLAAGVHHIDVSHRLGHARPSITLDIYSRLMPATSTAGTEAIERAIVAAR